MCGGIERRLPHLMAAAPGQHPTLRRSTCPSPGPQHLHLLVPPSKFSFVSLCTVQSAALGFLTGAIQSLQSSYVFLASFILGSVMAGVSGGWVHEWGEWDAVRLLGANKRAATVLPIACPPPPSLRASTPAVTWLPCSCPGPRAPILPLCVKQTQAQAPCPSPPPAAGPGPRHQDHGAQGLPGRRVWPLRGAAHHGLHHRGGHHQAWMV